MGYISNNLILRRAARPFFIELEYVDLTRILPKKRLTKLRRKPKYNIERVLEKERYTFIPSGPGSFQGPFCCSYRRLKIDFQGVCTFQTCPVGLHARFVCKDQEDAALCIPHLTFYNLKGGYTVMNRYELIIMLTVLGVGMCLIILILLRGL
jgi:hypothetical protein